MFLLNKILRGLKIKKAQANPQVMPQTGYNANRGQQMQQDLINQNRSNEMLEWLNKNVPIIGHDPLDIELALQRDGRGDWMDDDLFYGAMNQYMGSATQHPPSPQVTRYKDLSRDQIKDFLMQGHDFEGGLPPVITENDNNMATYQEVAQELAMSDENFGDEAYQDPSPFAGGVSSDELADAFEMNYLLNAGDEEATNRYMQMSQKFPDLDPGEVLRSRVFRGVSGGIGEDGSQDFRIKFFIENASWLDSMNMLPQSVKQLMDGEQLSNKGSTYKALANDIDNISNDLMGIIQLDDPDVKNRIWNWVSGKLGSEQMGRRYRERQHGVDDEGAEFQHADDGRRGDGLEGGDTNFTQDQRSALLDAYKGDMQGMADGLRYLGRDMRNYMMNDLAQRKPSYGPGGNDFIKTLAAEMMPDQAASLIESIISGDIMNDPKAIKDLQRKGRVRFAPGDVPGKIIMKPAEGESWDTINWDSMLGSSGKIDFFLDRMTNVLEDPESYRSMMGSLSNIGNIPIDAQRMQLDENYRKEIAEKLKKSRLLYTANDHVLGDIGQMLTSDEITSKYPRNLILAYLSVIRLYSKNRQFGALLSENSKEGVDARKNLLLDVMKDKDREKKKHTRDQGGEAVPFDVPDMTPEQIASMDDDQVRAYVDEIIDDKLSKLNISRRNVDFYRDILDLGDIYKGASFDSNLHQIKVAIGRIFNLRKLASSMSKFASTDTLEVMRQGIVRDMMESMRIK